MCTNTYKKLVTYHIKVKSFDDHLDEHMCNVIIEAKGDEAHCSELDKQIT